MDYFSECVSLEKVRLQINRTEEEIKSDVEELKSWIQTQKHMPKDAVDECMLEKFAIFGKGNLNKAKTRLDIYFTVRNFMRTFENRDPLDPEIIEYNHDTAVGMLPGLTPDGSRVLLIDTVSKDPSRFNNRSIIIKTLNVLDIWLRDDPHANRIYLLGNATNGTLTHMMKLSIRLSREGMYCFQSVYPVSLRGAIIINSVDFVRVILENILKPVLSKKIAKRFAFYGKDYTLLYEDIPLKMLPRDYGGEGPSVEEINQTWIKITNDNREWILNNGSAKTDESLREGKCPYSSSCSVM